MWDYEAKFSTNQAVTATAVSDNVVKVPQGDAGKGRPLYIQVNANLYTGDGSFAVEVQTADTDDMANLVTLASHPIENADILRGGPVKVVTVPTGCREFLRLNYVVTGALAGGNISAGLVLEGQTNW